VIIEKISDCYMSCSLNEREITKVFYELGLDLHDDPDYRLCKVSVNIVFRHLTRENHSEKIEAPQPELPF